ncbi:hypothetical protein BGZ58_007336 [Dissophora ornata]|nr:hypothetical protein BGZ58_007336 [Dissophora ornata]
MSAIAIILATLSVLSTVSASITCALPAGGSYKAGDSIILDWGSDGTSPVVSDITSINGTLYCNGNSVKISDVSIPNLSGPYNWTVPGVGNATTVGGTVGTCPQNAFHIEYSGQAAGFLSIVMIPWGPVRCGTVTILPASNGTLTTTTTTMSSTTMSSTSTSATSTPTDSSNNSDGGGISTTIIVVIAAVAAVLATLSVVAIVAFVRRHRRQRKLDNAFMPWNSNSANQFSKVSSMDDGLGSPRPSGSGGMGMTSIAAAGAGAGVGSSYEMKPQPTAPQPTGSYYPDDGDYGNYAYHQQQQQLLQQQQQHQGYSQQGYDGYNDEDSYYNPYYAGGAGLGLGAGASVTNQSNPPFYSMNQSGAPGSRTRAPFAQDHYQGTDLSQQPQQQHMSGYFPPPPPPQVPSNSSPASSQQSYSRTAAVTGAGLTSIENTLSASALTSMPTDSSASSSPKRAPQTVMQEMGRREAEEETNQDIPPASPTHKVLVNI